MYSYYIPFRALHFWYLNSNSKKLNPLFFLFRSNQMVCNCKFALVHIHNKIKYQPECGIPMLLLARSA